MALNKIDKKMIDDSFVQDVENVKNTASDLTTKLVDIATTLKPNGVDDHAQIIEAINSNTITNIRFTKGVYKIFKPIIMAQTRNKKLIFDEGAEIYWQHGTSVSAMNTGYEGMFRLRGCKDIQILGGNFYTDGIEVSMGNGTKSQWMHFFYIDDAYATLSENILIDGAKGHDFPGDFFELYGVKNITIKNCVFDRCWRTGISPVKCENVWIENNTFSNCSLETTNEFPGGINFEADLHEHYMLNIFVTNNIFKSNTKGMSFTPKSDRWGNIHIKGNYFEGRTWMRLGHTFSIKQDYNDVFITDNNFVATSSNALYQYPNTLIENLKFTNCRFEQIGSSSMIWITSAADISFEKCFFLNHGGTSGSSEGIIRTDYTDFKRNLSFRECKFVHKSGTTGMNYIIGVQANLKLIDCDLTGLPALPIFVQHTNKNNTLTIRNIFWHNVTLSVTGSTDTTRQTVNLYIENSTPTLVFWDSYSILKGYSLNSKALYFANPAKVDQTGFKVIG